MEFAHCKEWMWVELTVILSLNSKTLQMFEITVNLKTVQMFLVLEIPTTVSLKTIQILRMTVI
jgi:hypothetical protein